LPQEAIKRFGKLGGAVDLALPQYQHVPSMLTQLGDVTDVALAVPFELWPPVLGLRPRQLAPVWAIVTMPKAAVHEYHPAMARQHDVRMAGQPLVVKAISVTNRVQRTPHDHLGLGIGLADAPHALSEGELLALQ